MNALAPVTETIHIVLNVNVDTRGFESIFKDAYKTGVIHEDYEDIFTVKLLKGYNPDGTDRLIVNMA